MIVGLCWMGSPAHRNDGNRSLPRTALAPLEAVEGVQWVALSRDGWTPELAEAGFLNGLKDCNDWWDTAQAIAGLDLIITVDTAIAHCAGMLKGGPPVWLLLAAVPDMRWMLDRPDTPWYRSVRLYRQQRAGDWPPVIARVAADLQTEVHARRLEAA